jgi:hypothetical protein
MKRVFWAMVVGLVVTACDPSASLAVNNQTNDPLLIRITNTAFAPELMVDVYESPAHTFRQAIPPQIGTLTGKIEVLGPDCRVLTEVKAQGGSVLQVDPEMRASIDYLNEALADNTYLVPVAKCGGRPPDG